jgi:cell division protein ZapA (FtsZ GTPase activity inhibitor)
MDQFNPYQCPWLTEWIEINIAGEDYNINFDEIEAHLQDI